MTLLQRFKTRKAAVQVADGEVYREILLRSASPADGDDEELVRAATALGLTEADVSADIQAVADQAIAAASISAANESAEQRKHSNASAFVETHGAAMRAAAEKRNAALAACESSRRLLDHIGRLKSNLRRIEQRAPRVFGVPAVGG